MLALAEILALIVANALVQWAFLRWKSTRRMQSKRLRSSVPAGLPYPQHPSPVAGGGRADLTASGPAEE